MNETHESHRNGTRQRRAAGAVRTLDELARLSSRELRAIYDDGTVPELGALDGDLVGRMLAVKRVETRLAAFSRSARFPWAGKSFEAVSATRGKGINRVTLGGRHRLFPFETFIGASVLDGRPAVILDYDLADNPGVIRAIHDEVREVAPKIFLGPACVKRPGKKPALVLWFALDANYV